MIPLLKIEIKTRVSCDQVSTDVKMLRLNHYGDIGRRPARSAVRTLCGQRENSGSLIPISHTNSLITDDSSCSENITQTEQVIFNLFHTVDPVDLSV